MHYRESTRGFLRAPLMAACACLFLVSANSAWASSDTDIGADGTDGDVFFDIPPTDGTSASSTAATAGDASNDATAIGGKGGDGDFFNGDGADGGNASATATTSVSGAGTATAVATGGAGGTLDDTGGFGLTHGNTGMADAIAQVTSSGSTGDRVSNLTITTHVDSALESISARTAESRSVIADTALRATSGGTQQVFAFGTGQLLAADEAAVRAANPALDSLLDKPEETMLGLGAFGVRSDGTGDTVTANFLFEVTLSEQQSINISFLKGDSSTGAGFDSMDIDVLIDGVNVETADPFDDHEDLTLSEVLALFDDNAFHFGHFGGGTHTIEVQFSIDTSATAGDTFYGEFVIFTPIPGAAWLFGSGFIALLGFARRRNS